jgi:LDH2 family malate/lactate/ureidoglycolate dehydrogenase
LPGAHPLIHCFLNVALRWQVELAHRKGVSIPNGWGVNADGKETNVPAEVLEGGGLLPLGGVELTSGYKGYGAWALTCQSIRRSHTSPPPGLAMMVEVLCGILANGTYGPNIRYFIPAMRGFRS